jgi:hypothetical protein
MRPIQWNTTRGRRAASRWPAAIAALLLGAAIASPALATEQPAPPARFAVQAELRPMAVSSCGRFAIEATARYTPQAKSADGRFVLKAVNVPEGGCEAFPDPLFSNGFEGP